MILVANNIKNPKFSNRQDGGKDKQWQHSTCGFQSSTKERVMKPPHTSPMSHNLSTRKPLAGQPITNVPLTSNKSTLHGEAADIYADLKPEQ